MSSLVKLVITHIFLPCLILKPYLSSCKSAIAL